MASEVVMPKLGAQMEEGTIVSWLVGIGEEVEEGDPLVEIQTDKITMEVEAEETGILLKTLYDADATVPVQSVIAFIGEEGEHLEEVPKMESVDKEERPSLNEETEVSSEDYHTERTVPTDGEKVRRTPAARKLAEENQVLLHDIQGTGPLGRVQKIDVERYLKQSSKKVTPLAKKMADDLGVDFKSMDGTGAHGKVVKADIVSYGQENIEKPVDQKKEKRVAFKGMRKVIAERISSSAYTSPHVTLFSEVDMTNCVSLRKQLLPIIEQEEGERISFNEILIKASAFALKQNPGINISLDGNEIVYHSNIHVGMAVAVPDGLLVPVLKNVDQKGLGSLTKEAKHIGRQARDGKIQTEDLQGSTFTVSNLGMYAVDGFTPIINHPNAAILGVGRIQQKPVIVGDEVAVRSMMKISLSFDHRIIDGAPAGAFLTDLKDVLENPFKLMI